MDRKKIIVNEIKYWKKNRLLPEQYCNFLLTLYTEGEETGASITDKDRTTSIIQIKLLSIIIVGLALLGLTFLVIYFTDFPPVLQIGLALIFSLAIFSLAFFVKKFDRRFIHFFIMTGALMFFMVTVHTVGTFFPHQPTAIFMAVIFTCCIWIYIGKKYKLKYLIISGIVGCFLVVYFHMLVS